MSQRLVGYGVSQVPTNGMLGGMAYQDPINVTVNNISVDSGTLTVSAGTTALPSISPSGDSNTGIFFPSADTIAVSPGGTEAMRITSTGNLLVGSTGAGPGSTGRAIFASSRTYTNSGDEAGQVHLINTNNTVNNRSSLQYYNSLAGVVAGIDSVNRSHTAQTGDLQFWTVENGGLKDTMRMSNGSVTTSYQPRANISKTVGQTLTTTAAKITFNDETYDVGGNFSSSRYTAPVSGYYLVSTSVNIEATAGNVTISVYKNGALYGGMNFIAYGANIRFNYSIAGVVFLSVSDYIEIFGVVSTGTVGVDNAGFLSIALLG